jgi:hypothetical protein
MDATEAVGAAGPPAPDDALWDALEAAGGPFADAVAGAVEGAQSGDPVAVVGAPFGGRRRVLASVADRLDARRVTIDAGDDPPALDGPTVVTGTGRLHRREIGGFDALDAFLDQLDDAPTPVVTGWNAHAWSYLRQARDVDRRLDAVRVPAVEREAMAALVERWAGTGVTFRAAPRDQRRVVSVEHRPVRLPVAGEVSVPVPRPRPGALSTRPNEEDPEAAVVRRLTALADGNPGVARALWDACVAGEVSPADLRTPVEAARDRDRERERRRADTAGPGTPSGDNPGTTALDRYDAFCLRLVLAAERLPVGAVASALGPAVPDAGAVLARLERRGYLTVDAGVAALRPAAVPDAVALTEGRRIP